VKNTGLLSSTIFSLLFLLPLLLLLLLFVLNYLLSSVLSNGCPSFSSSSFSIGPVSSRHHKTITSSSLLLFAAGEPRNACVSQRERARPRAREGEREREREGERERERERERASECV